MTAPLEAAARRDLYALTARLFAVEVDVALYRALAAQDTLGLIDAELYAMGEERALEALAVEFCRLFVGPQPPCVPYASAHRGEALLGGRARTRLEAFLHRVGFTCDEVAMRIARRITSRSSWPCWRTCIRLQTPPPPYTNSCATMCCHGYQGIASR